MYKLSNLYKRAQYGKGKGKAGLRRVGGGGVRGGGGVIVDLYKHPVKHPLVLYSPELP